MSLIDNMNAKSNMGGVRKMIKQILHFYYKLPFRPLRKQLAWLFGKYNKRYSPKEDVIVNRKGINFNLNTKDVVEKGIYYDFFEPTITRLFENNLPIYSMA